MDTRSLLETYRLRLINLSQQNRSLRLLRTYPRQDVDLPELAYSQSVPDGPAGLLNRFFSGRPVRLLREADRADSRLATLDRHLTLLYRELRQRQAETGAYDLAIGYPFVEGRFGEGTVARCPLVLFPATLVRNRNGGNHARWQLQLVKDGDIQLNPTFFRAYEKYGGNRLAQAFWEDATLPPPSTLQTFLNALFELLKRHGIAVLMPSRLFLQKIEPLRSYSELELQKRPQGQLTLVENAVLGLFPQSDTALLQDYNTLVADPTPFPLETLLGEPLPQQQFPLPPANRRWYPLPIDSSQEEVLAALEKGADVVVDGPPGTGKSQLIVNATAAALAAGRRVLVVSEKRAALEVVRKRLGSVGLSPWVYQIHDHSSDKQRVYQQLKDQLVALEAPELPFDSDGETRWHTLARRQADLVATCTDYLRALREPLPCGYSPATLYERVLERGKSVTEVPPAIQEATAHLSHTGLVDALHRLRAIARYPELLDTAHPWHIRPAMHGWDDLQRQSFEVFLAELPTALARQTEHYQRWARLFPASHPFDTSPAVRTQQASAFQALLDQAEAQQELLAVGLDALATHKAAAQRWMQLLYAQQYLAQATHPDQLVAAIEAYQTARMRPYAWLRPTTYGKRTDLKRLLPEVKLTPTVRAQLAAEAADWQAYKSWRAGLPEVLRISLSNEALSKAAEQWNQAAETAQQLLASPFHTLLPGVVDGPSLSTARTELSNLLTATEAWHRVCADWAERLPPEKVAVLLRAVKTGEATMQAVQRWQTSFVADAPLLAELDVLLAALSSPEQQLLASAKPLIVSGDVGWDEKLTAQVESAWLAHAERDRPALLAPLQRTFAPNVEELQARVEEQRALATELLPLMLATRARSSLQAALGKTAAELRYQLQKQRRLWPLRRLVATFWPGVLADLMPVVLASPETVAAVFPLLPGLFDLVVIDEASQCRVEAALPVLLRGKQRLVAGDDKQLPPFDVFRAIPESGYEDSSLATDAESILALARAQFVHRSLRWHYRSSDPRLVGFSNMHFYGGHLRLLQQPGDSLPPFQLERVAGRWENQRNAAEASSVVAVLEQHLQANPIYSLGVVTFNYRQQEAVWDAIDSRLEALQADESRGERLLSLWHAALQGATGEALFVRNLENVQGDERDVIVFSTGYARDASGKLHLRFGLLNQLGGENRLNVAVTRARHKVVLVTSIRASDLQVDDALHEGPRRLRDYIAYVESQATGGAPPLDYRSSKNSLPTWLLATHPTFTAGTLANVYHDFANSTALHVITGQASSAYAVFVYLPVLLSAKGWQHRFVHLPAAVRGRSDH